MAFLKSFGSTIAIGSGNLASTPTYTDIGQVFSIEPGDMANSMADVTHFGSTNGAYLQIPTGMRDEIEISFSVRHDPDLATHTNSSGGIYHAWANKTELAWELTLTDTTPTVYTMDCYVSNITMNIGDGSEAASMDVTLAVTGDITVS